MYYPLSQFLRREMSHVVRTRNDPMNLAPSLKREVLAVDAAQPVSNLFTMEDQVRRALFKPRPSVVLPVLFAGLPASVGGVGIFAGPPRPTRAGGGAGGVPLSVG